VTIVVSGFLSEKDDSETSWMGVLHQDPSKQYFNLRWKSKHYKDVASLLASAAGKLGLEVLTSLLLGAEIGLLTGVFWSIGICR
jgi:hypothetical protein